MMMNKGNKMTTTQAAADAAYTETLTACAAAYAGALAAYTAAYDARVRNEPLAAYLLAVWSAADAVADAALAAAKANNANKAKTHDDEKETR